MIQQLIPAFFLSSAVASLAFWRGSLSKSGVVGALLVGTLTFGLGGWFWGLLLGIFFISSSLLSHFKESEKKKAAEKFEKGHRRDFWQALANGGIGALIALLNVLLPSPIWYFMFTGTIATVTADTWATEVGTLSQSPPRLITTGEVVEVGTSGGVSLLGTAVSTLAGLIIGLAAGLLGKKSVWKLSLIGALSGLSWFAVRQLARGYRAANFLLRYLPKRYRTQNPQMRHRNPPHSRLRLAQQRYGQLVGLFNRWYCGCFTLAALE